MENDAAAEPCEHGEPRWFTLDEVDTIDLIDLIDAIDLADPAVSIACRRAVEHFAR